MAKSRLHELSELGQSVWIDFLSRQMLQSGELARMMEEDAVVGVTSNPTIFQKAIAEGDAYDEQLREVLAEEDDPKEVFLRARDRRTSRTPATCCAPVWDGGDGQDGYVSIEVDPNLAYDTHGDDRRGAAPARAGRPAELLREDPGDRSPACRRSRR